MQSMHCTLDYFIIIEQTAYAVYKMLHVEVTLTVVDKDMPLSFLLFLAVWLCSEDAVETGLVTVIAQAPVTAGPPSNRPPPQPWRHRVTNKAGVHTDSPGGEYYSQCFCLWQQLSVGTAGDMRSKWQQLFSLDYVVEVAVRSCVKKGTLWDFRLYSWVYVECVYFPGCIFNFMHVYSVTTKNSV